MQAQQTAARKTGKTSPKQAKALKDMKPAAKGTPTATQRPPASAKPLAATAPAVAFKPSIAMDAPKAAVERMIASIKLRGAKLDTDLHSAACACLNHLAMHGDVTLINRLVLALPKTARRNALMVWAMAFGKVMLNPDQKTIEVMPLAYDRDGKTDLEGAVAKPFWEFRNVREGGSEWLYMDYIAGVMKTLARHALTDPKAKAALDAITATNEALNVGVNGAQAPTFVAGVTPDRRNLTVVPA